MRALIIGSTGMVGRQVLQACLAEPTITRVGGVSRRDPGLRHDKLDTLIHPDFSDFTALAPAIRDAQLCYYTVGVYVGHVSRDEFFRVTVDYLRAFVTLAAQVNPSLHVALLSAQGASRREWGGFTVPVAKGRAENILLASALRSRHIFRPGYIRPPAGTPEPERWYYLARAAFPILPWIGIDIADLVRVMLHVGLQGYPDEILSNGTMRRLAARLRRAQGPAPLAPSK